MLGATKLRVAHSHPGEGDTSNQHDNSNHHTNNEPRIDLIILSEHHLAAFDIVQVLKRIQRGSGHGVGHAIVQVHLVVVPICPAQHDISPRHAASGAETKAQPTCGLHLCGEMNFVLLDRPVQNELAISVQHLGPLVLRLVELVDPLRRRAVGIRRFILARLRRGKSLEVVWSNQESIGPAEHQRSLVSSRRCAEVPAVASLVWLGRPVREEHHTHLLVGGQTERSLCIPIGRVVVAVEPQLVVWHQSSIHRENVLEVEVVHTIGHERGQLNSIAVVVQVQLAAREVGVQHTSNDVNSPLWQELLHALRRAPSWPIVVGVASRDGPTGVCDRANLEDASILLPQLRGAPKQDARVVNDVPVCRVVVVNLHEEEVGGVGAADGHSNVGWVSPDVPADCPHVEPVLPTLVEVVRNSFQTGAMPCQILVCELIRARVDDDVVQYVQVLG
mmetsp:Transcript_7243/g.8200  ORF Transcript_7243/g.8200 Transcript_7243/m.8200 type:complete len:446 (-) Transcript_7243:465-1802(-)